MLWMGAVIGFCVVVASRLLPVTQVKDLCFSIMCLCVAYAAIVLSQPIGDHRNVVRSQEPVVLQFHDANHRVAPTERPMRNRGTELF